MSPVERVKRIAAERIAAERIEKDFIAAYKNKAKSLATVLRVAVLNMLKTAIKSR